MSEEKPITLEELMDYPVEVLREAAAALRETMQRSQAMRGRKIFK